MTTAIVILAAGSSSRMGTAKQLLPVGETTLLGLAVEHALDANANHVFCVLGAQAEQIIESLKQYPIEIIHNLNYQNGLSSSIKTGIQYLEQKHFDAILLMLGDQPNVNSKYLNSLINTFKNNPSHIIASEYSGTFGVPAIFPKTFYKELVTLEGDKGAKVFLNANKENVISIESKHLTDIDTQEAYLNFLNSL